MRVSNIKHLLPVTAQDPGNREIEPLHIEPLEFLDDGLVGLATERGQRGLLCERVVEARLQPRTLESSRPRLRRRIDTADVIDELTSSKRSQLGLDLTHPGHTQGRERIRREKFRPTSQGFDGHDLAVYAREEAAEARNRFGQSRRLSLECRQKI